MSFLMKDIKREFYFLFRKKNVKILLAFACLLSIFSITTGLLEINKQQETIARLIQYDQADRNDVLKESKGYGNLAYYSRHLTYVPPSALAFSAIGQRDVLPWKHRVKILALEGQIYETDADNPELAYVGRIDFSFVISVLAPLFIILLLHDIRAVERTERRYDLLIATSHNPAHLWLTRIFVGVASLSVALFVPFIIGAIISNTSFTDVFTVLAICTLQLIFWTMICHYIGGIKANAPQIASMLLGLWLITTIIIPVAGSKVIDEIAESPRGGDIVLVQREAVNSAWDKPYEATFNEFLKTHPKWQEHVEITTSFSWTWYYAFQQVGDQAAEPLSIAYRQATIRKNELAGVVAWLSPAMLIQRALTHVAQTDTFAMQQYQQSIRDFHAELRHFYYAVLFPDKSFDKTFVVQRPQFTPFFSVNTKKRE